MQMRIEEHLQIEISSDTTRQMDCIIFQAEREFELSIWPYPFEVILPRIESIDELIDRIDRCNQWLLRFHTTEYMAFPNKAIGQYRECHNNSVFFKDPAHALAFKLRFS